MAMSEGTKTALVTGANRGLGREIAGRLGAAGLRVVTAARDAGAAKVAADEIVAAGGAALPLELDVNDPVAIAAAAADLAAQDVGVDVLVNNAGILIDGEQDILGLAPATLRRTLETNVFGPLLLTQAVLPGMLERGHGRVVNMSSTLGTLGDITDPDSPYAVVDSPAYRLSKGALNLLTALFARVTAGTDVLVNAACPGWVRTDMGSDRAPLSVEEGADTPVWLATLPEGGPSGGLYRERRVIPW
jgi:NAD(P)-dependent dehydrogenase (short-subunit alcohol dehydrogenase family)